MNLYRWKRNNSIGFFSKFSSCGEWGSFHQITSPNMSTEIPLHEIEAISRELTPEEIERINNIKR